MKKIMLICFIILLNNTYSYITAQTEIPNSNFEDWEVVKNSEGQVLYEELSGSWWGSLNQLRLLGGPVTTTKETDAYHGNFAVRLETKPFGTFSIPGLLSAGYFDTSIPNFMEGRAFTGKPNILKGYYKFNPVNNDSASIYIGVFKFNNEKNELEVIGEGSKVLYEPMAEYTPFEIQIKYYKDDVIPDSIHLTFVSCAAVKGMNNLQFAKVGTTFIFDNIKIEYTNDVQQINIKENFTVNYKSDSKDIIINSSEITTQADFCLYSLTGTMVNKEEIRSNYVVLSNLNLNDGL
mgnify:FL=1